MGEQTSSDVTILHMSQPGARPLTAPRSEGQMTWARPLPPTRHLPSQRHAHTQTPQHANVFNFQRDAVKMDKVTAGQTD